MVSQKPPRGILSGSKHRFEGTMIPKELNITPMLTSHVLPPLPASSSISTRAIIDGINRAMTWEQRVHAFQAALSAFSHQNPDLHSYEIDLGAVQALVLQFGACLSSNYSDSSISDQTKEEGLIQLILQCLYQILSHCSTRHKIQIWQDLGATELLPLLLQLPPSPLSWSFIRIFCKISNAKSSLLAFPGLVKQLVDVIEQESAYSCNHHELVTIALGAIKDLSFKSDGNEKRALWKNVFHLTETMCRICKEQSEECRHEEYIVAIWWNLALCPTIAQEMISMNRLMGTLQRIMVNFNHNVALRRSSVAALGTLVATTTTGVPDMPSTQMMMKDKLLWNSLIQLVKQETDTDCRRRGLRTVRCLTAASKEHPPQLINILADVAQFDNDEHARLQALEALRHIDSKTPEWTLAIVSVITAENSKEATWEKSRSHALACSILQSNCDPSVLISCAEKEGFLEALSKTEATTISKIISVMASNGGEEKLLSDPGFLLLSKVLASSIPRLETLRLIKHLADSSVESRKKMAQFDPLLTAIVNLCLSTRVVEEKQVAKTIIVALVAEL